jgi:predicted RNA-binding Zn-ribbon protein involved in translation (DUF1610 family)
MTSHNCPSCRVAMEEGFLLDKGDYNAPSQQEWAEGAPEPSFWTGLKLKGKEKLPVTTFRCPNCGLLQSYAS